MARPVCIWMSSTPRCPGRNVSGRIAHVMPHRIACVGVTGALVLALFFAFAARTRDAPGAGATLDQIRAFALAKQADARRSHLPFREVTYFVSPLGVTLNTEWHHRPGHPFAIHAVEFPFQNDFQKTGQNSYRLVMGPRVFTGTNISHWELKWSL